MPCRTRELRRLPAVFRCCQPDERRRRRATGFKRDDAQSWREALKAILQAAYDAKHKDALEKAVRESIRNTVADDERDNREERT